MKRSPVERRFRKKIRWGWVMILLGINAVVQGALHAVPVDLVVGLFVLWAGFAMRHSARAQLNALSSSRADY